jgi:hypothetical protein
MLPHNISNNNQKTLSPLTTLSALQAQSTTASHNNHSIMITATVENARNDEGTMMFSGTKRDFK